MDILVTTPKSEIDNSKKEGKAVENSGGYWFRTFKFKPKVEIDDKIYFTENGQIVGYGIIFEISKTDEEKCDITDRVWKGNWIVKYDDWHWLKKPVPFKGFMGIRYIERLDGLKERLIE